MNSDRYNFSRYVYLSRWVSYWHQIDEVLSLRPEKILVVGKGDGIVAEILKKCMGEVKTLDLAKELEPDFTASVEEMLFEDNSFDAVLCAEVLEHLPFEKFEKCLCELRRVAKKNLVLSLPHFGPPILAKFKIPLLSEVKLAWKINLPLKHKFNGEHYWEIGKKGYSLRRVRNIIKKYFAVKKEFVPFENQYHRFFILEKKAHG